jgi:hypothetical protein
VFDKYSSRPEPPVLIYKAQILEVSY